MPDGSWGLASCNAVQCGAPGGSGGPEDDGDIPLELVPADEDTTRELEDQPAALELPTDDDAVAIWLDGLPGSMALEAQAEDEAPDALPAEEETGSMVLEEAPGSIQLEEDAAGAWLDEDHGAIPLDDAPGPTLLEEDPAAITLEDGPGVVLLEEPSGPMDEEPGPALLEEDATAIQLDEDHAAMALEDPDASTCEDALDASAREDDVGAVDRELDGPPLLAVSTGTAWTGSCASGVGQAVSRIKGINRMDFRIAHAHWIGRPQHVQGAPGGEWAGEHCRSSWARR